MEAIGVDVGGSGIKGAIVDVATGELVSDRVRIPSPAGFGPDDVVDVIAELVWDLHAGADLPLGVGFPSVIRQGITRTDPTSHEHPGWKGLDVAAAIAARTERVTTVANDADVAGRAELEFGAVRGRDGVVMVFTFGTGIGSAVFVDGTLVPNVELGRIYLRKQKKVAEYQAAARVREEEGLGWGAYAERMTAYLTHVDRVFSPDLMVIGGGIAKKPEKWLDRLEVDTEVVVAELGNRAGIVGAALMAARRHA